MKSIITKWQLMVVFVVFGLNAQAQNIVSTTASTSPGCDGTATVDPSMIGSTNWSWLQDSTSVLQNGGTIIDSLCPGFYSVSFMDSVNNPVYIYFYIDSTNTSNPCINNPIFVNSIVLNATSANDCNGSITATVTGGTSPYSFDWSNNTIGTNTITNLCSNLYFVSVTDINGCLYVDSSFVGIDSTQNNPCANLNMYTMIVNATFPNECTGSIDAVVTGGTGPYIFTWPSQLDTTHLAIHLCAGPNTVTVTDANSCTLSLSYVVGIDTTGNTNPCMNSTLSGTSTSTNVSDTNNCNGILVIDVVGGVFPYQFTEMNGISTTNPVFDNLCPGVYVITVEDSLGCVISVTGVINGDSTIVTNPCANSDLFATISTTNVSGVNLCDGSINVTVAGGASPYSFYWNTGDSIPVLDNVCSDVYTVMIHDANGCVINSTGYVGDFIDSTFAMDLNGYVIPTGVSEDGNCDGIASVITYGGTAPYTYLFSDGSTVSNAYNLCAGLQSVTVTDANGGSMVLDFIISSPINTFTNPNNYSDSTLVDSVYNSAISDCIINFSIIDSAYIMNYNILPNDSIIVTWSISFNDSIVNITNYYGLGTGTATGVYMIALQVYCPDKSIGQFLTAYDQVYYNAALAGIGKMENNVVSVYPNPFNDQVMISLDNEEASEVSICDMTGKEVFSKAFSNQLIQIDTRALSAGQYVVTVKNNSSVITQKIVK